MNSQNKTTSVRNFITNINKHHLLMNSAHLEKEKAKMIEVLKQNHSCAHTHTHTHTHTQINPYR